MTDYDVIVIGAGVAGLVSSLKLSKQGKKVLLLEKQPIPGGFATTFQRKGFTFESSLHCVDSLGPEGEIRKFLKEFNIDTQVEFIELDNFCRIIYPEHDFVANFNCADFISFLKENFPKERTDIDRLFKAIDKFYKQFDIFSKSNLPGWFKFAILPFICPSVLKTSLLTVKQFIDRFIKDEKLLGIITDIWRFLGIPPSRLSALYFLLTFSGYYYNKTAYIKGGFSKLFEVFVSEIQRAGSECRFNTLVAKIITDKNKRIKFVVTDKGEEFSARAIISNANAIDTFTGLLDNQVIKEAYREKLSRLEKSVSAVQVYLGLRVPAKTLGMNQYMFSINTTYNQDENLKYCLEGAFDKCSLELVDHAQIDPTLVPEGKGSLLIMTLDSYSNWKDLKDDEYKLKKQELAQKLISHTEQYLPGLSKVIEVMEVATPRTMRRFTLSPEGAIYGFAQTVAQSGINRLSQETPVKGLFLAGAWTRPGHGVSACFISGMDAADLVSHYLHKLRY